LYRILIFLATALFMKGRRAKPILFICLVGYAFMEAVFRIFYFNLLIRITNKHFKQINKRVDFDAFALFLF